MAKFKWHYYPKDRTFLEKVARRFVFPNDDNRGFSIAEWNRREARLKRMFPLRWFLSETIPDVYRNRVKNPISSAKQWIRFRTWDKYHVIRLEQKPGYRDPDSRMLNVNFQILKDYVEIELGAMNLASNDSEAGEPISDHMNRFKSFFRKAKLRNRRYPEEGLAYLDWEIEELSGPNGFNQHGISQGDAASEKRELYLWWTTYRPARLSLYDDPLIWDRNGYDKDASLFDQDCSYQYHLVTQLEEFYEAEDQEMLIRLMKIRKHLWI